MSNDTFANPQPPSNYTHPHYNKNDSQPMTNDDFRKLLMTPSVGNSVRAEKPLTSKTDVTSSKKKFANEASERRKEKKLFYASLTKEAKEREAELAQKYRDRAKERREQSKNTENPDYINTTGNFRAVAPGFSLNDNADRRRQIIEESKYLGGDLEHTHLVKGLDYALLQKVKAETEKIDISKDDGGNEEDDDENHEKDDQEKSAKEVTKDQGEDNDEDEYEENDSEAKLKLSMKPKILTKTTTAALAAALNKTLSDSTPLAFKKHLETAKHTHLLSKANKKQDINQNQLIEEEDESKIIFKTKLARNVYRVLFEPEAPKQNDLFMPHRMAYIVDLNDEETDVPITSIRSKADCPNNENNTILTTNDIVINKLTQILSYLRHGKRDAKKSKKKALKPNETSDIKIEANPSLSIYDDIGDYVPDLSKKKDSIKKENEAILKKGYFGSSKQEDDLALQAPTKEAAQEFIKNINEKYSNKEPVVEAKKEEKKSGLGFKFDADSYSECYPGTRAEEDVNIDSDEETDFSKMDLGNKKGPVNRWDFETNEEYNDYMSNREAMPKAAFQYGLKMTDGRKTRRLPGENAKNEKSKLDKEWTQISKLIDKRKSGDYGSLGYKKPKY